MKKYNKILIISILFISIFMNFILLFNKDMNIRKEVKVVKGMTESTQISDLNTQINELNKSHTEYANYIQTSKQAIATALTNEGVATSENDTLEAMANNIEEILQARTKDATAIAEDIKKDKTAYVNGVKITGTGTNNNGTLVLGNIYGNNGLSSETDNIYITLEKSISGLNGNYSTVTCNPLVRGQNATLKLYLDGALVETKTITPNYPDNTFLYSHSIEGCDSVKITLYGRNNGSNSYYVRILNTTISS